MTSWPFTVKLRDMAFTIWYTPDLHVRQQGRFWEEAPLQIQFTPTREFGLLCITPYPGCPGYSKPLQGYVIERPRALEFSIRPDVDVAYKELDQKTMLEWCEKTKPWMVVRPAGRYRAISQVTRSYKK